MLEVGESCKRQTGVCHWMGPRGCSFYENRWMAVTIYRITHACLRLLVFSNVRAL